MAQNYVNVYGVDNFVCHVHNCIIVERISKKSYLGFVLSAWNWGKLIEIENRNEIKWNDMNILTIFLTCFIEGNKMR